MQRPFKPSSKAKKTLNGPAFLWKVMQETGERGFTVHDLVKETSATSASTVKSYVLSLIAQGYVARADLDGRKANGTFGRRRYVVIRASTKAPVQRRDNYTGERGEARHQLWNAMRILPSFGISELALAASTDVVQVSIANARAYVAALLKTGMILALQPHAKGAPGRKPGAVAGRYRLKPAFKAPLPPKVQKDGVFDPNSEVLFPFATDERIAA